MQRLVLLLIILLVPLLAACMPTEPLAESATPLQSPANTTQTPLATTRAVPSATPTEPPPTATPTPPGLRVWHSFAEDSAEAQVLARLIDDAPESFPDTEIILIAIPGDEIVTRFEAEAAAGGGPDVFIAPNDRLGRQARAGLLQPVDSAIEPVAAHFASNALAAMQVGDQTYGAPLTRSTVALYYDRSKVPEPPRTTQALLDAARNGTRVVLVRGMYHTYGFIGAFGGQVIDESGRCVADQGGVAKMFAYLRELRDAGVEFATSGAEAEARFRERDAAITINGSWLRGDFGSALGDDLGVAALPSGPAGAATPLISGVGVYVNTNTRQPETATAFALALTSPDSQQMLLDEAQLLPAATGLTTADESLAGFIAAAESGMARPHQPAFDAFWAPFEAALAEVLETDVDPVEAVQRACEAMNAANGIE